MYYTVSLTCKQIKRMYPEFNIPINRPEVQLADFGQRLQDGDTGACFYLCCSVAENEQLMQLDISDIQLQAATLKRKLTANAHLAHYGERNVHADEEVMAEFCAQTGKMIVVYIVYTDIEGWLISEEPVEYINASGHCTYVPDGTEVVKLGLYQGGHYMLVRDLSPVMPYIDLDEMIKAQSIFNA